MRHRGTDAESDLREWLLEQRRDFRHRMCSILCENPDWSSQAWEQLSPEVDALANGKPARVRSHELPDGHWALAYGPDAGWELGSDEVLRLDK